MTYNNECIDLCHAWAQGTSVPKLGAQSPRVKKNEITPPGAHSVFCVRSINFATQGIRGASYVAPVLGGRVLLYCNVICEATYGTPRNPCILEYIYINSSIRGVLSRSALFPSHSDVNKSIMLHRIQSSIIQKYDTPGLKAAVFSDYRTFYAGWSVLFAAHPSSTLSPCVWWYTFSLSVHKLHCATILCLGDRFLPPGHYRS